MNSTSESTLTIQNATILTPSDRFEPGALVVENGRITHIGPMSEISIPAEGRVVEGTGLYLVPGFIDLQVNGAFGHNFTTNPETIWNAAARLPQYGVTSFLPTIVTSPLSTVGNAQSVLAKGREGERPGATPLGLHAEGPFINPLKKGAHDPAYIRQPKRAAIAEWSSDQGIRLVTLAPELPGALPVVEMLASQGVVVSAGHSMATYEQAQAGFRSGIRYGTHLYNAMPPAGHRNPGLVGALLDNESCTVGLIYDGIHVHPAMVNLAWKVAGCNRFNLVSDAMTALGMPPGRYEAGERVVMVTESDARLADGTLAGSIAPIDQALRNLIAYTQCTLPEALATVTTTPAKLLGFAGQRGQLAPGMAADIVLLSPGLEVQVTISNGKVVYHKEEGRP